MAIDPSIALGYKGIEAPNPLAQYAQVAQIQNAQNQNALAQFQMRAAQRGEQDVESIRNALSGVQYGTPDYDKALTGAFLKTGNVKGLQEYQKGQRETEKAGAELQLKNLELQRDIFGNLAQNTSDDNIRAHLQDMLIQKRITPQEAEGWQAKTATMNPVQRKELFTNLAMKANERVAHEVSRANNAATVGATIRGQNMTDAREATRIGLEKERVQLAKDEGERKKQGLEGLPPKELQKREAALPAATAAIKGFETKSDSFVKDLEKLRDHPGLDQITGIAAGRLPGVTADGRAAQALYDKIVAKGGFQALQDLRDASKTGGALGNVSNQEGKQLSSSFAAIQRTQDAPDVRAAIDQAIGDIQGSKTRMREAYDSTYSYKQPAAAPNIDALLDKYK